MASLEHEIAEIRKLRKKYDLTQTQLSKISGVSQSLIAKIESGRIEPTYVNVRKIFSILTGLDEQKQYKAEEIMVKKIISCSSTESVGPAIKKMRSHNISQLPIIDNNVAVGLVTETNLLEVIASQKAVFDMKLSEIMQEAPPIVSKKTILRIILDLLKFSPLILIADNGKFEGVITKSDILRFSSSH